MINNLIEERHRNAIKRRFVALIQLTAVNVMAVAAFALVVWAPSNGLALAFSAIFLGLLILDFSAGVFGTTLPVRLLVLAGLLIAWQPPGKATWLEATIAAAALFLVLSERMQGVIKLRRQLRVAHLPGYQRRQQLIVDTHLGGASIGLIVVAWFAACFSWPTWPMLVAVLVVALAYVVYGLELLRQVLRSHGRDDISVLLEQLGPRFLLYWSAPPNSEFQLFMWLPYLDRIGVPYAVILREPHSFDKVAARTSMPVIVCDRITDIDMVMVPTLKAVFYVNNGMKNTHAVRFSDLTHIQLLHGDSDKSPSYNPVTGMFDQVFVAGEAAIDRYETNGVEIPRSRFTIVGRPQVEDVRVAEHRPEPGQPWTVLYAPTWRGYTRDANYSSLSIGVAMVSELIARGATVLVRAHPYTNRDGALARNLADVQALLAADRDASGRQHLWGDSVTTERTLFDCFNMSDALVSDVSSVVSDYLYSEKPFAITDMLGEGDSFAITFPLAKVGYVLAADGAPWQAPLDAMFGVDPLGSSRRELKAYYLGDFAAEHYADHFVTAARGFVTSEA